MRKRDSKRRWKARYGAGKYITLEAVYNHRLETLTREATFHPLAQMLRRPTTFEQIRRICYVPTNPAQEVQ